MAELSFKDFSGGITDNYVGAPINKYETGDNFIILNHAGAAKLVTRPGSDLYNETYPRLPAISATYYRIQEAFEFENYLIVNYLNRFYYLDTGAGYTEMVGPVTSNSAFSTSTTSSNYTSITRWNKHLIATTDSFDKPVKIFPNASSVPTMRTAGLPALASSPTCAPNAAGAASYTYRFVHKFTYTVGTVTFIDRSSYTQVSISASSVISGGANRTNITNIPVLANGATGNYDTANIKIEIYRTVNGGTAFFYVGEVTNGTTTYTDGSGGDGLADGTLTTRAPLYTEGGVVQNDAPPLCKFVHVVGDVCYYGHAKVGSEIFDNRIYQSVPGDVDSVPATFYIDLDDKVRGLTSVKGFLIALCENGIYRIEGQFDLTGRGGMVAVKISDTASCVSGNSAIQTLEGCFWAGRNGFFYSDGYTVFKITDELDASYATLVNSSAKQLKIKGAYNRNTRQIFWSVQEDDTIADNSHVWVGHLEWGVKPDMAFTKWENGEYFSPTSISFTDDGNLIRGDKRGYIFEHNDLVYSDPRIDVNVATTSWDRKGIIYVFHSSSTDFEAPLVRKWVTNVVATFKNITNASVLISSNNDDNRKISALKPIRFRGNLVWGDPTPVWGDEDLIWDFDGIIEEKRRFPSNSIRCSYKQIQVTNAFVVLYSSDDLGNVDVDSSAKTATLVDAVSIDWPAEMLDYYIAFENDSYVLEYQITAQTSDVVTFLDPLNTSATATGSQFVIRGYPKNEALKILALTMDFEVVGKTQLPFRKTSTGELV